MTPPPGWAFDGTAFVKTFVRADFDDAIAFVNVVARVAGRLDHHPDLHVSWNEVTVRTWSHDRDTVTERDVALAAAVDALP